MSIKWLIYSREHNAWWSANRAGYSITIESAGRYTTEEADAICSVACIRTGMCGDGVPEFKMLAPECAHALNTHAALRASHAELVAVLQRFKDNGIPVDIVTAAHIGSALSNAAKVEVGQ